MEPAGRRPGNQVIHVWPASLKRSRLRIAFVKNPTTNFYTAVLALNTPRTTPANALQRRRNTSAPISPRHLPKNTLRDSGSWPARRHGVHNRADAHGGLMIACQGARPALIPFRRSTRSRVTHDHPDMRWPHMATKQTAGGIPAGITSHRSAPAALSETPWPCARSCAVAASVRSAPPR